MPRDAEMERLLLRGMADGREYRSDELEGVLAKGMGSVGRDLDARAEIGSAADMRRMIGQVRAYLKRAGLVSYPSRGSVRITEKGLAEIGGDAGCLEMQDGRVRGEATGLEDGDEEWFDQTYSPPLSPAEIADIEAIASGAVKLRRVSKSEFLREIVGDTRPEADIVCNDP